MTLSAAKMRTDLAQAREDVATLSPMLTGVDRIEFDHRAANMLNTMTGMTKIQSFIEENNRTTLTRAEVFELIGSSAPRILDKYDQENEKRVKEQAEKHAVETREAERLQTLAVQTVQRNDSTPARDAATIKRNDDDKRVMRDMDRLANDAHELTRQDRANLEFEQITNDSNLTYMQKIAALQKMDNPSNTFEVPEPVKPKPKPLSPIEQILEHVRQNPHLEEEIARRRARDYSQER